MIFYWWLIKLYYNIYISETYQKFWVRKFYNQFKLYNFSFNDCYCEPPGTRMAEKTVFRSVSQYAQVYASFDCEINLAFHFVFTCTVIFTCSSKIYFHWFSEVLFFLFFFFWIRISFFVFSSTSWYQELLKQMILVSTTNKINEQFCWVNIKSITIYINFVAMQMLCWVNNLQTCQWKNNSVHQLSRLNLSDPFILVINFRKFSHENNLYSP